MKGISALITESLKRSLASSIMSHYTEKRAVNKEAGAHKTLTLLAP